MSNWNEKSEAALRAAAPVSFESAQTLAGELGVSTRAVISKVKSLGLDYIPKAKAGKRNGVKKADLVRTLEAAYGQNIDHLNLDKNSMVALAFLIARENTQAERIAKLEARIAELEGAE